MTHLVAAAGWRHMTLVYWRGGQPEKACGGASAIEFGPAVLSKRTNVLRSSVSTSTFGPCKSWEGYFEKQSPRPKFKIRNSIIKIFVLI